MTIDSPGDYVADLAQPITEQVLDAVVAVLPTVIPFLAAMWAISFIWSKMSLKGGDSDLWMGSDDDDSWDERGRRPGGRSWRKANMDEIDEQYDRYDLADRRRRRRNVDPWHS